VRERTRGRDEEEVWDIGREEEEEKRKRENEEEKQRRNRRRLSYFSSLLFQVLSFEVNSEKLPEFPRRKLNEAEVLRIQMHLFSIVEQLRKFFANLQPPLNWHRLKGCNMIDYDVGSAPVSFHLPLHRIFASFLSSACAQLEIERLDQLLPAPAGVQTIPSGFVQQLIEHPLQLQVLMAQELANLWVRNGAMVPQQSRLYR
jgi:hypothetical protein